MRQRRLLRLWWHTLELKYYDYSYDREEVCYTNELNNDLVVTFEQIPVGTYYANGVYMYATIEDGNTVIENLILKICTTENITQISVFNFLGAHCRSATVDVKMAGVSGFLQSWLIKLDKPMRHMAFIPSIRIVDLYN